MKRVIIVVAILAVLAGGYVWHNRPLAVSVVKPQRQEAIQAVYATGTVEPTVQMPVAPRSGGRLQAIAADEGQRVQRGQVLARVESRDLDQTVEEMRAREQLAQAQFERTRQLLQQHFISSAEFDRARTELRAAQAATRRAQALNDYNQLVAPTDGVVIVPPIGAGTVVVSEQHGGVYWLAIQLNEP